MEASMKRLAVVSLALLGLAACAAYDPAYTEPTGTVVSTVPVRGAIITAPVATVATPGTVVAVPAQPAVVAAFRPGFGVIESVAMVRMVPPAASASAGSSRAASAAYRLMVRMDDGSVQTIDQDSRSFLVGDRIQITSDGFVRRS
jgi:hypothetical protein